MKIKKILLSVLSLCLCFSATFASACDSFDFNSVIDSIESVFAPKTDDEDKNKDVPPDPPAKPSNNAKTLLENQTGTVTINVDKTDGLLIETNFYDNKTELGSQGLIEGIFDGGENKPTVCATGGGAGAISPIAGAKLTFKNLVFTNDTFDYSNGFYYPEYLEFGGTITFENCEFDCHVFLCQSANIEFKNCKFTSANTSRYCAWVCEGSAKFVNCTFTGYRGIKIHEDSSHDVVNVFIDGCTFTNLQSKPGIAIGDIHFYPSQTVITVQNSQFNGCQPVANDSVEGYNGLFEKDYATVEEDGFVFNWQNLGNFVDGVEV